MRKRAMSLLLILMLVIIVAVCCVAFQIVLYAPPG